MSNTHLLSLLVDNQVSSSDLESLAKVVDSWETVMKWLGCKTKDVNSLLLLLQLRELMDKNNKPNDLINNFKQIIYQNNFVDLSTDEDNKVLYFI